MSTSVHPPAWATSVTGRCLLAVAQARRLGARTVDVRRMVVTQTGRVALAGVLIGLVIALYSARWHESFLFDVHARDPIVFGVVSVVMLGVALLASYLPARRASGVDPVEAIRVE